jgi:predicted 2-oxoglutarate/Fe(II)-dependent dioxygenase YbiX/peroxiredoxin
MTANPQTASPASATEPFGRPPEVGEPARFFTAPTTNIERYSLDTAAGRWIVLMVFGTLSSSASVQALDVALRRRELFNDTDAAFYGVTVDGADRGRGLIDSEPGVRFFWDLDRAVSRLYGLVNNDFLHPAIFLIDPAFRIAMAEPVEAIDLVLDRLQQELHSRADQDLTAPVLVLPRILEPELCAQLIDYYGQGDRSASGFAVEVDGQTVTRLNPNLKRRTDVTIEDPALEAAVRTRLETRLFPMIKRALGWQATRIERYLIACYSAEDRGFFFPHRDDATAGTAHRKFAVTLNLNLNAEDYEGGDLRFLEFGPRTYRPPTGGACVFSCALLHEATPVTRGVRYAVVPFLYDEDGERVRQANLGRVGV